MVFTITESATPASRIDEVVMESGKPGAVVT
jgi:hypothetical protein